MEFYPRVHVHVRVFFSLAVDTAEEIDAWACSATLLRFAVVSTHSSSVFFSELSNAYYTNASMFAQDPIFCQLSSRSDDVGVVV